MSATKKWDSDIHFAGWWVLSPILAGAQIQGIRSDTPRRRVRMDVTMSTTAGAKDVYVKTFDANVMEFWFGCFSTTKETIQNVTFLIKGSDPKENDGDDVSRR